MYKKITIKRFRCFDDFTIENLSKINLISGKNNVGKTSLLEAIWLFTGYHNPELGVRVDLFRGIGIIATNRLMLNLFRNFTQEKDIQISCEDSEGSKTLTITPVIRSHKSIKLLEKSYFPQIVSKASSEKSGQLDFSEVEFKLIDSEANELFQKAIYVDDNQIKLDGNNATIKSQGIFLSSNKVEDQRTLSERFSDLIGDKRQKEILDILKIVEPRA
jgi:AAA15 family ATPase/GTPase